MSKAIERGCRAEIINSVAGNNGTIVTVGDYIGDVNGYFYGDNWCVNKPMKNHINNDTCYFAPAYALRRIDYDGDEKSSWEEMKEIWNPETANA